jgi:putative tricarboxylic transport membrane protein
MDIFPALLSVISDPMLLAAILLAAVVGMVVGAIPGLTASAAIAMLLPITFYMDPLFALAFLYVIGKSGRYGGSIAAILFNTPGTAASAATQIDGYPLAKSGKAGKAMKVATISSVIGDFMGDIMLVVGVGFIAALALKLGPPETFAIYFAAFVVIGSVIGDSILKGLASALIGILVAMVGLDPISSEERYTFGSFDLSNGIGLVPLMIGVFVLGEVFAQLEERLMAKDGEVEATTSTGDDNGLSWEEYKPCLPHALRGGFIGAFIGVLPGLGSAIAAFISYGEGKRRAKNPEQWGKGALEGVAAPEAANNAVSGPSMAPLLTLGIPGSTIGAILLGVFPDPRHSSGSNAVSDRQRAGLPTVCLRNDRHRGLWLDRLFRRHSGGKAYSQNPDECALPDDLPDILCRRLFGTELHVRCHRDDHCRLCRMADAKV